jgi:hypothetical protein
VDSGRAIREERELAAWFRGFFTFIEEMCSMDRRRFTVVLAVLSMAAGTWATGLAQGEEPKLLPPLAPHESAKTIVDLRQQLGSPVFQGTMFQPCSTPAGGIDENQDMLVTYLRELDSASQNEPVVLPSRPEPVASTPAEATLTADKALTLRKTSRQLELAADKLEDQGLYQQSDELRELANQFRLSGRAMANGFTTKTETSNADYLAELSSTQIRLPPPRRSSRRVADPSKVTDHR